MSAVFAASALVTGVCIAAFSSVVQPLDLSGAWEAQSRPVVPWARTEIVQAGVNLTLFTEQGVEFRGRLINGVIEADELQTGLRGRIVDAGRRIEWSNGSVWRRRTGTAGGASTTPLKLYYHAGRGDNFSVATPEGQADAVAAGYVYIRDEGFVLTRAAEGTVPLKLYFHAGLGDYYSAAPGHGESAAVNSGYRYIRTEGYVYASPGPGRLPLKNFFSTARGDNFTTTTAKGEADAMASQYFFVHVEAYVLAGR